MVSEKTRCYPLAIQKQLKKACVLWESWESSISEPFPFQYPYMVDLVPPTLQMGKKKFQAEAHYRYKCLFYIKISQNG